MLDTFLFNAHDICECLDFKQTSEPVFLENKFVQIGDDDLARFIVVLLFLEGKQVIAKFTNYFLAVDALLDLRKG